MSKGGLPGFEPSSEKHPWTGIVPVTPVMDTQIDDITLRSLLLPLGEKILKDLEQKIMARRKESWFEIYLTTFIIMNNFERHFADIIEYTSDLGIKVIGITHAIISKPAADIFLRRLQKTQGIRWARRTGTPAGPYSSTSASHARGKRRFRCPLTAWDPARMG